MRYYPIFLKVAGDRVVFSGAGDHAAAKIRLLLKTEADIHVFGTSPCTDVQNWADEGRITLHLKRVEATDLTSAKLVYGANDDLAEDQRAIELGKKAGALVNIVDNLELSEFLTPAIVDRDPVTVAIGTEGTAPVLARKIKAEIEDLLPQSTGILARIGNGFRARAASLADSKMRRTFWNRFFFNEGPIAMSQGGEDAVNQALEQLYCDTNSGAPQTGHVDLVGAGPGDPEHLTLKARKKLHSADVVLHDSLVAPQILELVRREATIICVGKRGYGKSWKQDDISELMIKHARQGSGVVRLKSGDPAIYGRLDEEMDALDSAGISWSIVPGVTSATAAAGSIGASLTKRGRNSSLRFLTGHDVNGFANHDWKSLAKPGSAAVVYMGVKAATYFSARLLMHGASRQTPVTIVENASRLDQRVITTSLGELSADIASVEIKGPAILFLGIEPRKINPQQQAFASLALKTA